MRIGTNIEQIGYWRASTPFRDLRRQDDGRGFLVQKQPHLAGVYPESHVPVQGAVPIAETSALSLAGDDFGPVNIPDYGSPDALWRRWADMAGQFDFLRVNATTQRLNEEGGSASTEVEHYGSSEGVPAQCLRSIALGTGRPLWFGTGHEWTGDEKYIFFLKMANVLAASQNAGYYEKSNEVWQGTFPQAQYYMHTRGGGDFGDGLRAYVYDAVCDHEMLADKCHGVGAPVPELVLGAQFQNPWTSQVMLEKAEQLGVKDPVLAVAPYWGRQFGLESNIDSTLAMTNEEILTDMLDELMSQSELIQEHSNLARSYGGRLVAYEGGCHALPVGASRDNPILVDKLNALQKEPGMEDLCRVSLDIWRGAGGGEYATFALTDVADKSGDWGIADMRLLDALDTPKGRGYTR